MRKVKVKTILDYVRCKPVWGEREVLCLQWADLPRSEDLRRVQRIWREDLAASGGDRGTCVLGAGLAVHFIHHRKRKPETRVLVSPPGQADCAWCSERARRELERILPEGVKVFFEYGRMD